MDHVRIDEGIPRGRKPPKKPGAKPKNLKDAASGRYLALIPEETKLKVIEEAATAVQMGEYSHAAMDALGAKYGVSGRTVRTWLLADDRAEKARGLLINGELARTLDELREAKTASSPLPLACAREEFRAWSWMAERREHRLYGPKQEVTHTGTITVSHALQAISERRQAGIGSNDAAQLPHSSTDITDLAVVEDVTVRQEQSTA